MVAAYARLLVIFWLLCQSITLVSCVPLSTPQPSDNVHIPRAILTRRAAAIGTTANGTITVSDPSTRQGIPQGPATDGGGVGFSLPAILWLAFTGIIGLPMAVAGLRGWRLTTGASVGLGSTVCAWAAMINSVNQVGIPDLFLTLICFGIFIIGFVLGCFEFSRVGATILLHLLGGVAFGIRVVLLKDDLLLSPRNLYAVNWVIAILFGLAFAAVMIRHPRMAIVTSTSSTGTFLLALAADLVVNKQAGLSRGLRYLFDRNTNHLVDILTNGYRQPLSTRIIVIASLVLIPPLAFAQHKIFKAPWNRNPKNDGLIEDDEETQGTKLQASRRFSL